MEYTQTERYKTLPLPMGPYPQAPPRLGGGRKLENAVRYCYVQSLVPIHTSKYTVRHNLSLGARPALLTHAGTG